MHIGRSRLHCALATAPIDRAMTHMGGISTIFHAAPPLVSRPASGQPESDLIAHPSG